MKKAFALSVAAVSLSALALAAPAFAATISTQMGIGARGADVSTLQQALASDSSLYPQGLVTGYFGSLTAAAVSRFQAQQGLPQVGRVGPLTIAKFNLVYGGVVGTNTGAPIISGVGMASSTASTASSTDTVTFSWNTDHAATGMIYYSTAPLQVTEASGPKQAPGVAGSSVQTMATASLNTANSLTLVNLAPKATYYYMIQSTDAAGNVSVTWPTSFTTY